MSVPLLVTIAASFDASITQMGLIVSLGEFAGIAAPLLCRSIDRRPRSVSVRRGLVLLCAASLTAAASPSLAVLGAAFVAVSAANIIFGAASLAWIADHVELESRSVMVGRLEMSWSLALIVGVPIVAAISDVATWRLAYVLVAALALVAAYTIPRQMVGDPLMSATTSATVSPARGLRTVPLVGGVASLMASSQIVFVVYAAWLTRQFGLDVGMIGLLAIILGVGELGAVLGTIKFADRLGHATSAITGAWVMGLAALALAAASRSLVVGVILLGCVLIGFEFALISLKPLLAELSIDNRAFMLGVVESAATAGRGAGSLVGVLIFARSGMQGAALLSALLAAVFVAALGHWSRPSK